MTASQAVGVDVVAALDIAGRDAAAAGPPTPGGALVRALLRLLGCLPPLIGPLIPQLSRRRRRQACTYRFPAIFRCLRLGGLVRNEPASGRTERGGGGLCGLCGGGAARALVPC